jgi:hypothetical protein
MGLEKIVIKFENGLEKELRKKELSGWKVMEESDRE